jgi:hypothetical protein
MRLSEDLMAQKVLSTFAHRRSCRSFAVCFFCACWALHPPKVPRHWCHRDSLGPGCTLAHPRVLGSGLHLWRVRSKIWNCWFKSTNCVTLSVQCVGVLYAVNRSYVDTASGRLWVVTPVSSTEQSVRFSCNFVQEFLTRSCRASMRCLQIVDRCTLPNGVQELPPSFAYFWTDPGEYRCRVSPLDYGCLHLMSGYLHSLTCVNTRCPVSPSITCVYTRCPVSPSITGVNTRYPVSPMDYGVHTWCPLSPVDYGCLHCMSGISD